ncbi:hypothetical protein, partial [Niveispirillum sp.]|uniref:hypothetical protein n=1 Tax=Niveispirillum sp. TaxID=1917217 RepID=UPI001B63E97A
IIIRKRGHRIGKRPDARKKLKFSGHGNPPGSPQENHTEIITKQHSSCLWLIMAAWFFAPSMS